MCDEWIFYQELYCIVLYYIDLHTVGLPGISNTHKYKWKDDSSSNTELCTKNNCTKSTKCKGPEIDFHGFPQFLHFWELDKLAYVFGNNIMRCSLTTLSTTTFTTFTISCQLLTLFNKGIKLIRTIAARHTWGTNLITSIKHIKQKAITEAVINVLIGVFEPRLLIRLERLREPVQGNAEKKAPINVQLPRATSSWFSSTL